MDGDNPIPDVELNFSGSTLITRTDADGAWTSPELTGNVTVTPTLEGYVFTPASREVSEASERVDFEGARSYTLEVELEDDEGEAIVAARLKLEFADGTVAVVETDANGVWQSEALVGIVKVTPEDEAYDFKPPTSLASVEVPSVTFDGEMRECNSGSPQGPEPCVITRIKQLRDVQLDGHYQFGADIDASATDNWNDGKGFLPIGDAERVGGEVPGAFVGQFDGNGYTIEGLFIDRRDEGPVGLFAALGEGAEVSDLTLSAVDVTGGSDLGALAGLLAGGTIANVEVGGSVRGEMPDNVPTERVGGLVGHASSGAKIEHSHSRANVSGPITTSHVTWGMWIGGLVGEAEDTIINDSSSAGEVEGSFGVGGLVGHLVDSTIRGSGATGSIAGNFNVGGLVGFAEGTSSSIERSYSTGEVTGLRSNGSQYAGGLVGGTDGMTIRESFSHGRVQGVELVGGLVGENIGTTIEDSYSLSSVSGEKWVGGLLGQNIGGHIQNTYSAGAVEATGNAELIGGLIGEAKAGHTLSRSYWDVEASGIDTDGSWAVDGIPNAEALTTAQMSDPSNFVDWDFSTVWTVAEDGYPDLVSNPRDR